MDIIQVSIDRDSIKNLTKDYIPQVKVLNHVHTDRLFLLPIVEFLNEIRLSESTDSSNTYYS